MGRRGVREKTAAQWVGLGGGLEQGTAREREIELGGRVLR